MGWPPLNFEPHSTIDLIILYFFVFQWCQDHHESRRLKLGDLLVYPMQRITKYPLLLRAVSKKTTEDEKQAVVKQVRA